MSFRLGPFRSRGLARVGPNFHSRAWSGNGSKEGDSECVRSLEPRVVEASQRDAFNPPARNDVCSTVDVRIDARSRVDVRWFPDAGLLGRPSLPMRLTTAEHSCRCMRRVLTRRRSEPNDATIG